MRWIGVVPHFEGDAFCGYDQTEGNVILDNAGEWYRLVLKQDYDTILQAALELEKAYSEAHIYRYDETFITRLETIKSFRAVLKELGEM